MKQTVGLVGLGIMGGAYARNLLSKGFEVVGFDVDADRRRALEALGLRAATSPCDVARQCDCVVTSLPSPAAFHAVMSGPNGLVEAGRIDHLCLNCDGMAEFVERLTRRGVEFSERKAHNSHLYQLFMREPINGIKVELNFAWEEAVRMGRVPAYTDEGAHAK